MIQVTLEWLVPTPNRDIFATQHSKESSEVARLDANWKEWRERESYAAIVVKPKITKTHLTQSQPLLVAQSKQQYIRAHPDSGASGTYVMKTNTMTTSPASTLEVRYPNGQSIISTTKTRLAIPKIPEIANSARVFDSLKTGNLLSIGQLCDSDCKATFLKDTVEITNNKNEQVLTGPRDQRTGLWTVKIPLANQTISTVSKSPSQPIANGLIWSKTTKTDLALFHHAALGHPTKITLNKAIQAGFLKSFPGLNSELINKHLPKSIETSMGHLNQQYQGVNSTKSAPTRMPTPTPSPKDTNLLPDGPVKTNIIMAAVHNITHRKGTAYGDLAGRYLIPSNKGNN